MLHTPSWPFPHGQVQLQSRTAPILPLTLTPPPASLHMPLSPPHSYATSPRHSNAATPPSLQRYLPSSFPYPLLLLQEEFLLGGRLGPRADLEAIIYDFFMARYGSRAVAEMHLSAFLNSVLKYR